MHMYNLLDPIDTIWMKGIHVYSHLEVVATETSEDALVVASRGMRKR